MRWCVTAFRPLRVPALSCVRFSSAGQPASDHGNMSDYLEVSMYLDKATAKKYFSGTGLEIDNQDFSGYVVPFAPKSPGETIALKKFARAHRDGYVTGPPILLLTIKIPARFAVDHFVAQDIKVLADRPEATVGFTLTVNATNYPSMQAEVTHMDVAFAPDELLDAGLQLLR